MCFNKEVSFVVFLTGLVCSIKLGITDSEDKKSAAAAIFLASITLMQASEGFLWHFNNPSTISHKIFSLMILLTLSAQVLMNTISFETLGVFRNEYERIIAWILFGIHMLCLMIILIGVVPKKWNTLNSMPKDCNRLCRLEWDILDTKGLDHVWKWIYVFYYFAYYTLLFIAVFTLVGECYGSLFVLFTFTLILLSKWMGLPFTKGMSSFYCFSVLIICIIIILVDPKR
jgi:hypothetical protein